MAVGTDENVMKKERDVSVRHLSLALVSDVFTHYSHLHLLLSGSNDHYCFHFLFLCCRSLAYNANTTNFFSAKVLKNLTRPLTLTNTFNFSVVIYNISLPPEAAQFFSVSSAFSCAACFSLSFPGCANDGRGKEEEEGWSCFLREPCPCLCGTHLPLVPGCANDGRQREGVMFFSSSVGPTLSCVSRSSFNFQAVLMMGKGGRVMGFFFFLWVPPLSVWHLPRRLCKWWGMRRDGVIFCESRL